MPFTHHFHASRRGFLLGGAGLALAAGILPRLAHAADSREFRVTAAPARARLIGSDFPSTDVWGYNGAVPGPTLRLKQGELARIVVTNQLTQDTTVHCHGIRLPIGMDGVPGLSQSPIKPGESFTYAFTPPDAGTFWYHPHVNSLEQLGRGLAGVLIVEEAEPVPVDRDVIWMLADWRLRKDGTIAPDFGNRMEAAMAGRTGRTVTLNGTLPVDQSVRAGERIRLRLVNGALARLMALRFEGHRPVIVAIDGQPCDPHEPENGRLVLGPAMRIDVIIDMQGEPGGRYAVIDDFYDGLSYTLTNLAYRADAPLRAHPRDDPLQLPRNPLPEPDLATAERHDIVLQGGMMGAGMMTGLGGMHGDATPRHGRPRRLGHQQHVDDRRWPSGHAALADLSAWPQRRPHHPQPDRLVASDAFSRAQPSRAQPKRRRRPPSSMGRHHPARTERHGRVRLRRG